MSANNITFVNGQFFYDGSLPMSWSEIGKDIVTSLLTQRRYCLFGAEPEFTLNVLRHTGRTGKFHFILDDENSPFTWAVDQASELARQAEQLETQVEELKDSDAVNGTRHRALGGLRICEALTYSAQQMRERVGELLSESEGNGPLSARVSLPTVRCANPRFGADAIWWDAKARVFNFGGYQVGSSKLGRLIAASLARADEWVTIGEITVTVNYLFEMCRLVGTTGKFVDLVDGGFSVYAPRTRR